MIIETATVVWGKEYINDFFNISLRSLLSGKNLEYIKDKKLIINVIFKEGEKIFVQSFLNEKKNDHINAIFYPDTFFEGNKYECHSHIVKKFIRNIDQNSYIFFFYPDMILGKNFIKNIQEYHKYDLVFFPAPRIKKEKFINYFTNNIAQHGIDEEILNKFIIDNLHIKMHLMNIDSKYFNGAINWLINLNEYGMSIKCFHHTPIIIKRKIIDIDAIDHKIGIDDYISRMKLGSTSKIIEDSEKISWCSFENDFKELHQETNLKFKSIIDWISYQTTMYQIKNFLNHTSYFAYGSKNIVNLKKNNYKKNYLNILRLVKYLKLFQFYFKFMQIFKIKI